MAQDEETPKIYRAQEGKIWQGTPYFLLTAGYNTCYCNNIAPGETERTCRKVGAHRKANHPTGLSPTGMEYRKVYNRLKARKQRGKISKDEWNAARSQGAGIGGSI